MLKVIDVPTIYLVAEPAYTSSFNGTLDMADFLESQGIDVDEFLERCEHNPGQLIPEVAGRLCYMSFQKPRPGGNKSYLEHILKAGHGSVLEHSNYSFIFTGISRSCSHELIRHRAGFSYSQLSQRYVDESDAAFIIPYGIQCDLGARGDWERAMMQSLETYKAMVKRLECIYQDEPDKTLRRKKARQEARSVLPNATETKIFITGNARSWRNFIEQRSSPHADREIRLIANKVLMVLCENSPNLFSDYEAVDLGDGTFYVETNFRKV